MTYATHSSQRHSDVHVRPRSYSENRRLALEAGGKRRADSPRWALSVARKTDSPFAEDDIHVDSPERVEVMALAESGRFFIELEFAASTFLPSADPMIQDKFESVVGGSVMPSQEKTRARATMIELVVAARLKQRGAHVVFQETPDMVVTLRGQQYGLEVKRPQSAKKVRTHLAKARHQLEKVGLPGIVAFDADRLLLADHPEANEVWLRLPPDIQLGQLQLIARRAFFDHVRDEVMRNAKAPVVAVITSVIARAEIPAQNSLGVAFTYHVEPIPAADEVHLRPLAEFFGAGDRIRG